ncbi:MAG: radical SAM protein [Sandaracinaceae bacterium]|nr:radical SAM protein [Sandaracinaceae bacterium]
MGRLDELAPLDRGAVDPRYYARYGIDSVQTKRGCRLRCTYCTYPQIEGRSVRRKDPRLVADDLERVRAAHPGVRHAFVVDSVFNLPPAHAMEVCDAIIERGLDVPLDLLREPRRLRRRARRADGPRGVRRREIGSDSGTDAVLARLEKGFDTTAVRGAHEVCERAGLKDCHTFVLGTPGETLDDVRRTLDFVIELDPYAAILLPWVDDQEAVDPGQRAARRRLREDVLALLEGAAADFPRWILPPLGTNFHEPTFDGLRERGLHGPLWQHIRRIPLKRAKRRAEARPR